MKQLFTFVLAAMAFVACTQNDVEELTANRADVPETLTVGFEGGDTRIELNEALKTVWTEGDEVSVYFYSDANQKWQYQGETGERLGTLRRVDTSVATTQTDYVVVAYPYNTSYTLNRINANLIASLPAVQSYKDGSYGAEGNIMVAQSEFTQFSLRNVCGWLRVELTGEGESVKSITLRGNAGEQVAGLIYVDTATAEATLASEMGEASDEEQVGGVGGGLEFDDTVFTEVTLNCGEGVELDSEARSFYIGLLPQTFEEGITVEVECNNGTSTTKSTAGKLVVERNHIKPMESFKYDGVLPEVYELAYTTNDGKALDPYTTEGFGGEFMENIYDAATGRGVLKFAGAITTIPEQAFGLCENLTWIDLPEGITTIGASAFTGCSALEEITIPASVTDVGNEAFKNCPCVATINCNIVGRGDFYTNEIAFDNAGFTKVVIGDSVTTIGHYAFYNCDSLTSVTIPDSITTIGVAFYECSSLTSVHITDIAAWCNISFGDQPLRYGADLYLNNELVTELTIPDSVTKIGASAFDGCESLTSVTIPDSVTSIGYYAFRGCSNLTSVTIPDSVTRIGNSAFYKCRSLTSVTIPDSVTTIGEAAFSYCSSLTSVYCKATTPPAGGSGMFGDTSATIYIPEGSLREYKLAENWSAYADRIVEYDYNSTVTISYTTSDGMPVDAHAPIVSNSYQNGVGELTCIGKDIIPASLFHNCDNLTSVTIPDSVTTIGEYAFYDCPSLTSVTIPDSVTTIGDRAFNGCGSLTSVTIGDSVTTIGDGAFYGCGSLTSIYCEATTPPTLGGSSVFYSNKYGRKIYVPAESVDDYKSAENWSEYASSIVGFNFETGEEVAISNKLFYTAPEKVEPYDASAFNVAITSNKWNEATGEGVITFDGELTSIGYKAFFECSSLTSVTIPDSVTTIGELAFWGCGSLPSVTIGDSVTTIEAFAFSECSSLTSVTIGDTVTTIGASAFENCGSLTSVTIPDSVTTIGGCAFWNCDSLTSVTIGDSVTTIVDMAFWSCDSLTSVTIGDSVTTIGEEAFYGCSSLTSVYCKATTPPTLGDKVLWGYDNNWNNVMLDCDIYVPAESVEAYKAATNWSSYKSYIVGYDFENGVVVE